MWTCPKCGEILEDQFDSCWKCTAPGLPVGPDGIQGTTSDQPASPLASEFEFSAEQEKTIRSLASSMAWFSAFIFLGGVINLLWAMQGKGSGGFIGGTLGIIIGWLTHSSSQSFKAITTSQGSDVAHLMGALTSLSLVYRIQLYLILAATVLVLLLIWMAS